MDLVKMVAGRVGCDESTAKSALGIVLKLCKGQFGEEKFNMIAQYVPQIDEIMKSAPEGGGGGMLGAVTGMLGGGGGGGIGGIASAMSGFSELNLGPADAQKTAEALQEHVQEQGGEQAGGAIQELLGQL